MSENIINSMYQIWYLVYKIHLNHLKLHLGPLGGWRLGTTWNYWQIIGLMGGLILHQSFACSKLELVVFVGRDHFILPATRCQTCLSVSPLFAAVCVCRHTHTHFHSRIFHHVLWLCCWVRDCCQQTSHFPSILPFLSYSLRLWQIIGSSKVAIPNCLHTPVHPSIHPPTHFLLLHSLSLHPYPSPSRWCISVSHSHISTLSATLWRAVLKRGHTHTFTQTVGRHPNKLLSDLWRPLENKSNRQLLFYDQMCGMFAFVPLSLAFVSLLLCVGVCEQVWLSAHWPGVVPRGVCGGLYVGNGLKEKGTLVYNVSAVNLR